MTSQSKSKASVSVVNADDAKKDEAMSKLRKIVERTRKPGSA